jgi:trehalose 2-sulfotransferase
MATPQSARLSAVWHEQFDPKHDMVSTTPTVRYALCTTPRCGSHFLGHLLQRSGYFGYPLEYFNPLNMPEWQKRAAAEGVAGVVEFLENKRTSPNGCFGIKLHYSQLAHAVALIGLRPLIENWSFVLLRRQDVLGQAISWARASQTKAWISNMPERAPASYDRSAIAYRLTLVLEHTAGWQRFLAENGVLPLELTYEDVMATPADAVARIADLLRIDLPDPPVAGELLTRVQRSRASDDWRERFTADMREQHQTMAARGAWSPEITVVSREPFPTRLRRIARRLRHEGISSRSPAP